ncbi:MAG: branched-chain amino acid ABC transporter permease [Rhizobiaceae bacterium]|nr:branched-chain amino acid ABC transporter permease [Rhizobiaceae bacterium]
MRTGNHIESYPRHISLSDNPVVWFWLVALMAAMIVLPAFSGLFVLGLAIRILIAAVGAIGLNLLTGSTGQISLGQSGFLAAGCYTTGLLIADYNWPPELALPMSGIVAAALSFLVGIPSLRLKGLYLAITTLAFSFIITQFLLFAEPITHGPYGVRIEDTVLFGFDLADPTTMYYFCLGILVLVTLGVLNIMRTRVGRAFNAIRDQDIAARAMGINLTTYKLTAFAASSFIVGLAGGLMAFQFRFINVDIFSVTLAIEALAMIIVGGLGSVAGAIIGAAFIILLPEFVGDAIGLLPAGISDVLARGALEIKGLLIGLVIILTLRLEPDGLIGVWRNLKRYWSRWPLSV